MSPSSRVIAGTGRFEEIMASTLGFANRASDVIALKVGPAHPRANCNCVRTSLHAPSTHGGRVFHISRFGRGPGLRATARCIRSGDFF